MAYDADSTAKRQKAKHGDGEPPGRSLRALPLRDRRS